MARLSQKELLDEGIASALGKFVKGTAKLGAQTAAGAVKGAVKAADIAGKELTDEFRNLGVGQVAGAVKSGFTGAGKAFDETGKALTSKGTKLDEFLTDQGYIALSSPRGPKESKAVEVAELDYDEKGEPVKGEVYSTPLILKYEDGAWVTVKTPRRPGVEQKTPPSDKARSDAVNKNTAVLGDDPVEDVSASAAAKAEAPAAAGKGAGARSGEFGELVTTNKPAAAAATAAPSKEQEGVIKQLAGLVKKGPSAAQGIADIVKSSGQIFGTGADVVKKAWDTAAPIAKGAWKAGEVGAAKIMDAGTNILKAYDELKAGYKEGLGEQPDTAAEQPATAAEQPAEAPHPVGTISTPPKPEPYDFGKAARERAAPQSQKDVLRRSNEIVPEPPTPAAPEPAPTPAEPAPAPTPAEPTPAVPEPAPTPAETDFQRHEREIRSEREAAPTPAVPTRTPADTDFERHEREIRSEREAAPTPAEPAPAAQAPAEEPQSSFTDLPEDTITRSDRYKDEGDIRLLSTADEDGQYDAYFTNTKRTGKINASEITSVDSSPAIPEKEKMHAKAQDIAREAEPPADNEDVKGGVVSQATLDKRLKDIQAGEISYIGKFDGDTGASFSDDQIAQQQKVLDERPPEIVSKAKEKEAELNKKHGIDQPASGDNITAGADSEAMIAKLQSQLEDPDIADEPAAKAIIQKMIDDIQGEVMPIRTRDDVSKALDQKTLGQKSSGSALERIYGKGGRKKRGLLANNFSQKDTLRQLQLLSR